MYCHPPPVATAFCCSLLGPRGLLVFSVVGSFVGSGFGPAGPRLSSKAPGVFSHTRFFAWVGGGVFPGVARDLYSI